MVWNWQQQDGKQQKGECMAHTERNVVKSAAKSPSDKSKSPGKPHCHAISRDFLWRRRVGIEPTYAATNYNYWF